MRLLVNEKHWGRFDLRPASSPEKGALRSYDSTGQRLDWWPPVRFVGRRCACDVESVARAPLPHWRSFASREVSVLGFHAFWVLAELSAKLRDMPILEWLVVHRRGTIPEVKGVSHALILSGWRRDWTLGFGYFQQSRTYPAHAGAVLGFRSVSIVRNGRCMTQSEALA